jgi:hypothetical protein
MSTGKPMDQKKEEFRKYLSDAGVLELLTSNLVRLYEEPEKPTDAMEYLKNNIGGSKEDKEAIAKLKEENQTLKQKVAELQKAEEDLKAKLKSLPLTDPVTVPDAPLENIPAVTTEEAKDKEDLPAPALDETPKEKPDNAPAEVPDEPMEADPPAAVDATTIVDETVAAPAASTAPIKPPFVDESEMGEDSAPAGVEMEEAAPAIADDSVVEPETAKAE